MKKIYVTPIMELEAFVANEYVAGCWIVSCISGHNDRSFIYKGDTEPDQSTPDFGWSKSGKCLDYSGTLLGLANLGELFGHGGDHLVSVTPIGGPNPNSSV